MKHLFTTLLILCSIFSFQHEIYARITNKQTSELNAWIDSQFTKSIDSLNIAGATIVLMEGDSVLHMNGYGMADIDSKNPINSSSSIFRIASISKTFVATAIMQLYEEWKLDLDKDINSYLTNFQLESKFNDSITVRHLLTHTSGLDVHIIGSSVLAEKDVIPLAQYLKNRVPLQIRPSGKVASYTDQAYALLGLIVEEISGMPYHEYIRKNILNPLEMNSSGFERQTELTENYVTGYLQNGDQLILCKPDFSHVYPASGLNATASDMGNYITMFLNNGLFKSVQILESSSVAKMHNEPFRHYEKAESGWLLGFQEKYWNGMQIYGHTGSTLGFESQLSLIPEKNIGLFISTNSSKYSFDNKSRAFINKFINDLLAHITPYSILEKENAKITTAIGSVDAPLEKFAGTYRYVSIGYKTLDKLGVLVGLAPEIEIVVKDSILEMQPWHNKLFPDSDLTFKTEHGQYLAFGKDMQDEIANLFIQTFAYEKLKWYEPIKFQMLWIGSIILILLIYMIGSGIQKIFSCNIKTYRLRKVTLTTASLLIVFIAVFGYGMTTTDPMEFCYGVPLLIKCSLAMPIIVIALELYSFYLLVKAIRLKEIETLAIIWQSLIVLALALFIPWLKYYNLIGFNY